MKKVVSLLCLSLVLLLGACGGSDKVEKSEIKINENGVYAVPSNPSDAQAKLFNKLTKAMKGNDDDKVASLVAQNFAFDFFSLKNKESSQDVGGLTYLPENRTDEFKTFAMGYVYSNYATIKNDLGSKHLPMVNKITVEDVEEATINYIDIIPANSELGTPAQEVENEYDGYLVSISLEYDSTKADDLKESVVIAIINYNDRYCVTNIN